MARSRVEIDPKTRRFFQNAGGEFEAAIKREIVQSGHMLFDEVARNVPRDTGDLRRDLGLKFGALSAEVGFARTRFPREWRHAGWRAHFVHNGTKGSPERNIPPMRARPFLRNAWDRLKDAILERQRAAVSAVREKISRG